MDPNGLGPGNDALWKTIVSNMYTKEMDPFIAPKVQGILEASRQFHQVNVQYFPAPISKYNDPQIGESLIAHKTTILNEPFPPLSLADIRIRRVGYAIRSSLLRALHTMAGLGVTQETIAAVRKESEEPWRNMTMDVYLVWAQKR